MKLHTDLQKAFAQQKKEAVLIAHSIRGNLQDVSSLLWDARDKMEVSGDEDYDTLANAIEELAKLVDIRIELHEATIKSQFN